MLTINDMETISEKRIKSEFQIKYIILSIIPWTIYRIMIYAFEKTMYIKEISLQMSSASFEEICNIYRQYNNKDFIISILLIFVIFIGTIVIARNISNKYKIKKEYVKNIIKSICVLQLIISSVILFFFCVDYSNDGNPTLLHTDKVEALEKLTKDSNQKQYLKSINDVSKEKNKIILSYKINLTIKIVIHIICSVLSIKYQSKILRSNAI